MNIRGRHIPLKKISFITFSGILTIYSIQFIWHQVKPLPEGLNFIGEFHSLQPEEISFLTDTRYLNPDNELVFEEQIFPQLFADISSAENEVIADMFLLEEHHDDESLPEGWKPVTQDFYQSLQRAQANGAEVTFITDEINAFYGSFENTSLTELEQNGIRTIYTNLSLLRDSNPLYSSLYRTLLWPLPARGRGWLPHPFGDTEQQVTLPSYLRLLNFKANHRKVVVADDVAYITSANPHNPSSLHSNIAFQLTDENLVNDIRTNEYFVAGFSDKTFTIPQALTPQGQVDILPSVTSGEKYAQYITEKKIKDTLIHDIQTTTPGDTITLALFYISDRGIVTELKKAAQRGVQIRLILDPTKDAFGREKIGIPNRQVAHELTQEPNIEVRWYSTNMEQFHTKMVVIESADTVIINGGSSNLTRRNLDNYNLEANIRILSAQDTRLAEEVKTYLNRLWDNPDGTYTLDYSAYQDTSGLRYWLYRIQEFTGLSTF